MNKSDKYYLKKGKLELSMLDEGEDEYAVGPIRNSEQEDLFKEFEFEHTKRFREIHKKTQQKPQPTLEISKDISYTLHTMGQFLTKKDFQIASIPTKKSMKLVKVQKLEQNASSINVQEIELPLAITKENHLDTLGISKADQIKEVNEPINIQSVESRKGDGEPIQIEAFSDTRRIDRNELQEMAASLDYRSQEAVLPMEECLKMSTIEGEENFNMLMHRSENNSILDQNNIDNILASFFKPKAHPYTFSRELKKHIEKHIRAINDYK